MTGRRAKGLRGATIVWACLFAGCGGTGDVTLCMRFAPDDPAPLRAAGVDQLRLRALSSQAGAGLTVEQTFEDPDQSPLTLPALDFGTWQFVIQALESERVVATGRSLAISVDASTTRVPCMYVATVGTFGDTESAPPGGEPRLAFTDASGATLIATDTGLVRYDHVTGSLQAASFTVPVPLETAVWASLGDGQAAVIGRDGAGAIVGVDGVVSEFALDAERIGPLDGVAAIGVGPMRVLLIGGAVDPTTDPPGDNNVRVVDLESGEVQALTTSDAFPVRDAHIVANETAIGSFAVAGGNSGSADHAAPSAVVAVIDPQSDAVATEELAVARFDATVVFSGARIGVFGGRDQTGGPLSSIEVFQYSDTNRQVIRSDEAAPGSLATARAGGVAIPRGDEVVIAGGETGSAATDGEAESFRFGDATIGTADPPGVALASPVTVPLFDGTTLVAGRAAAVVYRP